MKAIPRRLFRTTTVGLGLLLPLAACTEGREGPAAPVPAAPAVTDPEAPQAAAPPAPAPAAVETSTPSAAPEPEVSEVGLDPCPPCGRG